jgi:hypothetical protein
MYYLSKENSTNASLEVPYLEMEVSGVTGKGDGAGGKWGARDTSQALRYVYL